MSLLVRDEEIISLAKHLIAIESHKEVPGQEKEIAQAINQFLLDAGIESEMVDTGGGRPNVFAQIKGKEDGIALMLNGHIDTIPAFEMDFPAFKPFIKDGNLYGRGAVDMKGAIAAMLSALLAVKREGLTLKKGVMFAGVTDEEQCSIGTEYIIKHTQIRPEMAVIGEPTKLEVAITHKGMEWTEVTFFGRSGHGSRPYEGKNAVYAAAEFINLVRTKLVPEVEETKFPLLGNATLNVGEVRGGVDPNIIPDKCIVTIDRRWLPSEDLDHIYKRYEDFAKIAAENLGCKYSIRCMEEAVASLRNTPHSIDPSHPLVTGAMAVVEAVTGRKQQPVAFPAWSDAALLSNNIGTKCIILGPGNINQAHTNNEFCSVQDILDAVKIYYNLIKHFCA